MSFLNSFRVLPLLVALGNSRHLPTRSPTSVTSVKIVNSNLAYGLSLSYFFSNAFSIIICSRFPFSFLCYSPSLASALSMSRTIPSFRIVTVRELKE
ncbi:MAG: hypothetical protein WA395_09965 [Nitrososphaeraceae archaeon]